MKGVYIINTESNLEIGGKVYYLSTNIPSKQSDGSYTNDDYAQAYANGQIIAAEIAKEKVYDELAKIVDEKKFLWYNAQSKRE